MSNISKSPDRYTFQAEGYRKRMAEETDPEKLKSAQLMLDYYATWKEEADAKTLDPAWQEDNMEYDLRTCDWMLDKVRGSDRYAQNLYAAICNNDFQKHAVIPILSNKTWSASWRHAGGIVADMQAKGDYIDWYCSGIGDGLGNGDADGIKGYVPESVVTEEVRLDLKELGWLVVDSGNED